MMVVAFPTFDELLRKVKQPDLPDLKPPQTEFDSEGASQFGYKLPAGWKLKRVQGQGDVLLSPRGQSYRDIKTDSDGSITDFKAFDSKENPIPLTPSPLPKLSPTEPPVNPLEADMEGPGIDIGLQPNEELFFDPQEGRMVRRIKPPPPLSPFQRVAQAAQASQDAVKGLGQLGLQAAKGAQDVFAPARALLTGRYPTREEQEQAGRILAASGQTGQDIAKSLVTFKPGETGLPPEAEAAMLLPGTGLTMGVGRAARLAATTARNVVPSAVARGLEVTKPILADERGGIRLPRKLPEEAAFAAQQQKAAKGVGGAPKTPRTLENVESEFRAAYGEFQSLPLKQRSLDRGLALQKKYQRLAGELEALKAPKAAKSVPAGKLTPDELKIKAALEVMTPEDRSAYYNTLAGQKKDIGKKQTLIDAEALKAKGAAKPLPGQAPLEQASKGAKQLWEMTKREYGKDISGSYLDRERIVKTDTGWEVQSTLDNGKTWYVENKSISQKAIFKTEKSANTFYQKRLEELKRNEDNSLRDIGYYHKDSVKQALSEGKPVPPEVLANYPELAAKAKPPAAETATAKVVPGTAPTPEVGGVPAGQARAPQGLTSGLPVQETTAENLQRLGENQRRANQGLPPVEAPIAPPSPTMPKPTEAVPPGVVGQAAPLPPSGKLADLIPEGRDNMTLRQAYQSAKAKGMVKTEAEFKTLLDSEIQAGTIGGGGGTSSKSPLNSRLGSGNITGYIERPKPEPIPPTKVAPGEAAITPPVGPVPPVKQATTRMKTIQAKGLNAPESVTPQEAKQAHIEMGAPDGPQPPKPPAKGRKRPAPDEPANILRQIAEKATSGERADQTLLRLHEGAITAETGRVGVIVRDGNAKLKAAGIGVYRRGQLVPRSNDIPQLDELYNALHNPSKVASGELQIPKGYEAIYKELRELTDWESVARLDFDPNMATVQDYFYRGWKPPEGMFANVAQGRPIVKTPAFKKPRVDATYQEMREAGFEPLFWNPYQQWGLSRMQGVKYREQMELVDKLKGMGDELIRPHAGGPIPQGWRVPEVGPAFEGKPFATTNPVTGEPMTMFTRRWITPDAVANMMENIYGKPPSVGKLIVGGKAFDPLAVIDWLTFVPKRAKLFGSFFQQIDFLNRNGAGAWSMLVDSLQAGKPLEGVKALAIYPVNAVNILRANFSPAYRQSLARQLNSTTPLIKGRPGVNLKGISEAGLSTIDPTMLQWNQMDKVVQAVARETGVFKRLPSLIGDIESAMRRGLFSGTYPAAMLTDIKHYTAPMAARMYPKLNDAQLNGQIARLINKKYSTLPASQSVIQNQVLRETLRRVFFSMGETEGLLRQATGAIRGPEAAYWRKNYIGAYLALIATASTIHFATTGKPLPKERYVPISKDSWGPLPFSYNTKFASPTISLKGREGAEVTLDVVGQMDTALRILDPGSFITARESTPIRALVNQISGTNFGGVSIDDVGPGGVLSRTAQLAQDLFAPIGAGPLAAEAIRENIPGAKELVAPQEARLGLTGLGVQATGINVRAANINDFIVDLAKIKGLPEREGQTPWDGTFEGLNPKEVAKLRRLPEAKAYAEALGETPANIERRVDERDFKAQEERSSWLGEWTGTGWSKAERPDPANPGKMIPYPVTAWKDDLSKLYTKKATEAATRERIQGEFKRRKPKDEKEKARWGYYEIADKYTEKDKKGKPIPGGKIQDMEGFMQEQDEYLAGLSPELEQHVIENWGVGDDPKATQFRIDKREIRKSYWKPLKDIEDPRSEDKLNEAQTLRIKGKIKEAESIEKVYHLAGYTMFKNDREDLLRRQNPQLDELLVKWGYGGSFKNPLNIDRQLGLDYPDKQELTKLYSAYYALPATSYLALSQAQVDAGRLPEKYKAEWDLYRKLKTDTAKGLFRKAHKEASNSDLQEEFRRSHPDFDEWLQQAKGLNPLKAEKAKKAPRIRSSVSLGSAGMRGFGGGVSKTSARKYPRFKKARVSRAMTISAPK